MKATLACVTVTVTFVLGHPGLRRRVQQHLRLLRIGAPLRLEPLARAAARGQRRREKGGLGVPGTQLN